MVGRPVRGTADDLRDYTLTNRPIAAGITKHGGKKGAWLSLPPNLFVAIRTEAIAREWSFNRMAIYLLEAAIDGIE